MSHLLRILSSPRSLVALAIVVGACVLSARYSVHHHGKNPFETLYFHLTPSPLVEDNAKEHFEREDYLLTIPAPGPLALVATGGGSAAHGGAAHGAESHGAESHAAESHAGEPFIALSNLQLFQVASVLLILVLFSGVPKFLRTGRGDAATRLAAGLCLWMRDEMVYPVMGKDLGARFLPYFLCIGVFILFQNLLGLVPGSATATSSIFVTGGLALTTLFAMLGCGMAAQGPLTFWKTLVPHVPLALWPLMFLVELIGLMVKPFALMVRLFANMTGGHMVVLSFMGLIFFFGLNTEMFGASATKAGLGVSPVAVAFGVFIMTIEAFVAMLQAYVFTQLSIIFVGAAVHPEH